jgi:hypothetical protein
MWPEMGEVGLFIVIVEQTKDSGSACRKNRIEGGDQVLLGVGGGWEAAEVVAEPIDFAAELGRVNISTQRSMAEDAGPC